MKNLRFNFKNYIYNFVVLLLVALMTVPTVFQEPLEGVALVATASLASGTVMSFIPTGVAFMAIQVEVWQKHIEEDLFKDNEFLRASHKADGNVIDSKIVHIPQSGGAGNVVKNRSTLPASIRKRTDTDVVYVLDEFTTDPVNIPDADKHELSYDKRASVLGEDMDKLKEYVANETIYSWLTSPAVTGYGATALPVTSIKLTTGDSVPASATGATGNRKALTRTDLQTAKTFLKKQKRWVNGKMYALITPEMEAQLFPAGDLVTATEMQSVTEEERREGVMYKTQGFKIFVRNTVGVLAADNTIKAPEAVGAATDSEFAMCWYSEAVEFAFGTVKAFENLGDPTMYGDTYSFLVRSGARSRRTGYEGICLIKQDTPA